MAEFVVFAAGCFHALVFLLFSLTLFFLRDFEELVQLQLCLFVFGFQLKDSFVVGNGFLNTLESRSSTGECKKKKNQQNDKNELVT